MAETAVADMVTDTPAVAEVPAATTTVESVEATGSGDIDMADGDDKVAQNKAVKQSTSLKKVPLV